MTRKQAGEYAQRAARSRSLAYDVVRIVGRGRGQYCGYDAFARQYDAVPRTDKGLVVTTFNCYGQQKEN
mgnify:FL=1